MSERPFKQWHIGEESVIYKDASYVQRLLVSF